MTEAQEKRRQELLSLKAKYNLTNEGIVQKLPAGAGSKKAVDKWTAGHRAVPVLVLDVLKHVLEGGEIISRETIDDLR